MRKIKKFVFRLAIVASFLCALFIIYWVAFFKGMLPEMLLKVSSDTRFLDKNAHVLFLRAPHSLCLINTDGSGERKIYDRVRLTGFSLSPDGKKVVFETYDGEIGVSWIDSRRTEVIENKRITGDASPPQWSPDSSKLAYSLGDNDVCIYDIESRMKECIGAPQNSIYGLKWLTDGQSIIILASPGPCHYSYDTASKSLRTLGCDMKLSRFLSADVLHHNVYPRMSNTAYSEAPNAKYKLYTQECSLWLDKTGNKELLVQHIGVCGRDFIYSGIEYMDWMADNRTILFTFRGKIYAGDIVTKKYGFLTKGYKPIGSRRVKSKYVTVQGL